MERNNADAFWTVEEIEQSIPEENAEDVADEEERAVFEYEARKRDRRQAAEKKVRARLEN